jgi:hypothetical protein
MVWIYILDSHLRSLYSHLDSSELSPSRQSLTSLHTSSRSMHRYLVLLHRNLEPGLDETVSVEINLIRSYLSCNYDRLGHFNVFKSEINSDKCEHICCFWKRNVSKILE